MVSLIAQLQYFWEPGSRRIGMVPSQVSDPSGNRDKRLSDTGGERTDAVRYALGYYTTRGYVSGTAPAP